MPRKPRMGMEVQAELEAERLAAAEAFRRERLDGLRLNLIDKRKRSIDWRSSCGIEWEWYNAEDAYEGIDDANRATANPVNRIQKPRSPNGGSNGVIPVSGTRSTVFLNITRPYTDGAAARVSDMLLPSDDRNFSIQPTPIPDMEAMEGVQVAPEELEAFQHQVEAEAKKRAEAAQTQIDDWLKECQYSASLRKVIEECAKLGTGVIKGPVPMRKKQKRVGRDPMGNLILAVADKITPASRHVPLWNFYPEPGCGENPNEGTYCWERDDMSAKQVRDLRGQPGYLDNELNECLREGPARQTATNFVREPTAYREDEKFEVWYFTGEVTELDFNLTYGKSLPESGENAMKVCVTVINDRIVRISQEPLDCEGLGYDTMCWQRRAGLPWGIGIAKQIDVPQRMLNAATRNMNDNAALSNGPQIALLRGVVTPADGVYELVPRKIWFIDPETALQDVERAFKTFDIPTQQQQLMNIIVFARQMAEETTGLPLLMQGQQGKAPDTVGGMEILNANGNTVLRRIARTFDDDVTEPHIRRYYYWIMEYGEEQQKGDYQIDARGSTSLVERDIQRQAILAMGPMTLEPRFGLDPKKWAKEMLRANKINPDLLVMSDEQQAAADEAAAQQRAQQQQLIQAELALKQGDLLVKEQALKIKQLELQLKDAQAANETAADIAMNRENNTTKLVIAEQQGQRQEQQAQRQERREARRDAQKPPKTGTDGGSNW